MAEFSDKTLFVRAFVYGFLSVCTFGLIPSHFGQTKAAQVHVPACRFPHTGGVGMLSDFRNISVDIVKSVRTVISDRQA